MVILWLILVIIFLLMTYYLIYKPDWEFFQVNQGVRGNNYGAECSSDVDCVPFFKCRMNGNAKHCF